MMKCKKCKSKKVKLLSSGWTVYSGHDEEFSCAYECKKMW